MDADDFDRFSRAFGQGLTRRSVVALLAGFVAAKTRTASAVQLAPAACGQAGAICTMLMGCCEGLTCVTSAINVNYGVCVPGGSGGTVAATTSLISPQSDGVVDQLAGATTEPTSTTSTTTSTTDKEAEKQARMAQRKARKDARQSRIRSRRSDRQDRNQEKRDKRRLARGPRLTFRLIKDDQPETLRVMNSDSTSVVLSGIESMSSPSEGALLSPPYTLGAGNTFLFTSGEALSGLNGNRIGWNSRRVCATEGDGFVVSAGFTTSSENHEYEILCDGPSVVTFGGGKGKKHENRRKRRNRNRKNRKNK